jgi:hypothetical protein
MKRNGTRRLYAALLALFMVLVLLPVGAAKAADEGSLAVGGTDIDLSQNGSYCDGKIVFEIIDGKNVLTLNGYKLENYNGNGISADGIDLTIVGSAEIGVTGAVSSAISVYESNLTLNGDFTLRAQSVTGATLDVYGYLTVEGGALDVENTGEGRNAIYVYDRMTVNGGTVHAKTNGAKAISARDGITLNNGEAFLSGNANASEVFIGKQYPLYVGGEQVNDLNKGDIFGDGTAKFEIIDGKNVLTLNGYKLENYNSSGIYADGIDLTIVGSAEISVTASAIAVNGNLTLNGDFTLRADRQTGAALVVVGNLTVEGGALDVENTYEGNGAISIPGTMTVNGGTVHAKANGTNAIYARIILNNGEQYLLGDAYASEVFIGKQYPLWVGDEQVTDLNKGDIFGDGTAKFEIIDGRNVLTLNDYKLENYNGVGISADGIDLTIVGSAEIGVTGAASSAISVYEGNLTLNGDFTLRAQCENGMALFLFGYLTVEGGALDVENTGEGSEAIYAHGAMTVNSGTVHAKANGAKAISAYSITLNNGEQYLLGDAYASEVKIGVPVEHTVTVVGGTADKTSAKAGDTVTITADDAEYGYAFLQWEMLEDVEFAKGDALTTTFKMPDHDVTVTPVYKEILISDIDDQTYTGEEITLTFGRNDLTLDGVDVTLINGTDYSLTYANNVDAGTATVTVTFHDRVTKEPDVRMGTKSKTFRIHPASIAAAEVAEIVDQTYQGKALTPEPTVTWNGKVLEKDTDYTLQYFNNVNVGTNPYVTVTGKGNFDENTDVGQSFRIIPAPLTITAIDQEYIYNGYQQGEGDTVYATPAEIAQKVTVEGLQGDDKLTSVILDGDATEPDTYPGRIQPSDAVIGNATGTVTGNYEITYVPGTLTIKPCYYTITFVNEDGTELQSGEVLLGKTPAYTGKEPTKPATAQYTYTFAGWKDENGIEYGLTDDLPAANGDMTYTAVYTSTVNEYTITFVNEDGTVLQEELIAYGETPEYTGEEPTKPATAQYTYIFAGWTPEVVPVAGDATYTATYTSTLNKYTIEFNAEDVQFKGATPYVIANGSAQEPRVVVKNAEGEIVPEDSYDVAYRENTAPGTGFAYVTFNDGSDYTLRAVFKIYIRSTEEMTVENTAEGIRLSWAPVEGAAGYIVYRRAWNNTRGSAWTTFERWFNTTETTWTDGSDADHKVYAGTRYQYGVKAYFEPHADAVTGQTIGGAFDNYNLGTVGPLVTTVRITTRTLKSVTPGTKRMTVKWEGSKYFTGYQIQYATDESFASGVKYTWVKDAATYETWIGNLTSGGTYWVRVRSYHEFEGMTYYGGWSNALSCTVK